MRSLITIVTLAFAALASSPSAAQGYNCLTITSPQTGATMTARPTVTGRVCQPDARVWVVVKETNYSRYWVQPEARVNPVTGAWTADIYIGYANTPPGEPFRMIAFGDRQNAFAGGETPCWPTLSLESPPVDVTKI